jgi:hypothetical protein
MRPDPYSPAPLKTDPSSTPGSPARCPRLAGLDAPTWASTPGRGRRTVSLDSYLFAALQEHLERQDQERLAAGAAWDNGTLPDQNGEPVKLSGLIFTKPDGRYVDPGYVTAHMWHRAKVAGLCCHLTRDAA